MTSASGDRTESPDDRALLAAHVDGDPDAFGALFNRHRDRLWAVALRTTGDPEDAADALQDAMISAFRRAESYRGDAAVTTWLHRIVVNACLDRLRRRKVRATSPLPDDLEAFVDPGGSPATSGTHSTGALDPVAALLDNEQRAQVFAALATLPPDQKVALVLVDMEGYSVDEAAAILGCPPGTVKSRCSRGRTRLRPLVQGLRQGNPTPPPRVQPTDPAPELSERGVAMTPRSSDKSAQLPPEEVDLDT